MCKMCNRPTNPGDGSDCSKDPSGHASCEVYLMDTETKKILPNRRYRRIDPSSGKTVLGTSDANGKLPRKFASAYVEVLPEAGKTYLDGAITKPASPTTPRNIEHIFELRTDLLNLNTSKTVTVAGASFTVPSTVNHKYIDWLDNRVGGVWQEYKTQVIDSMSAPASTVTNAYVEGVPSVPDGANLIEVNHLIKSFGGSQATNSSEYKYLNTLKNSSVASDATLSNGLENTVNSRRLPPQYFYVLGHGSPDVFEGYKTDGTPLSFHKGTPADLESLYDLMKNDGYDNRRTAVFLACNLGNGEDSFAERFAALEDNGTVYAFTGMGFFFHSGSPPFACLAPYYITRTTGTPPTSQQGSYGSKITGHWRIFNTATAAILDNP